MTIAFDLRTTAMISSTMFTARSGIKARPSKDISHTLAGFTRNDNDDTTRSDAEIIINTRDVRPRKMFFPGFFFVF
jgi:hypothetical protein